MQIQITDTITEDDQNALLVGIVAAYNRQFLRTTTLATWRCTGAMKAMKFWAG